MRVPKKTPKVVKPKSSPHKEEKGIIPKGMIELAIMRGFSPR